MGTILRQEWKYFGAVAGLTSIVITIIAIFLIIHALWFSLVDAKIENENLTKQLQALSHTCGVQR